MPFYVNNQYDEALLEGHLIKLNLPLIGQAFVKRMFSSDPAHSPQGNRGNIVVHYPSPLMGCILILESKYCELAGALKNEFNPKTIAQLNQPCKLLLNYKAENSKTKSFYHTPDFFHLSTDEAGFQEWKYEEELVELSKKDPFRYVKEENGTWRCPPGESAAATYGLKYWVRSTAEIDWTWQSNITFLHDFLQRKRSSTLSLEISANIIAYVSKNQSVTLADLIINQKYAADDLYWMIVSNNLYVNFSRWRLSEPDKVLVFTSREIGESIEWVKSGFAISPPDRPKTISLAPNEMVSWDGNLLRILNVGENIVSMLRQNKEPVELPINLFEEYVKCGKITGVVHISSGEMSEKAQQLLRSASPHDLEVANYRFKSIQHLIYKDPSMRIPRQEHERTIREWFYRYRNAENEHNCGFVGLLPNYYKSKKGNYPRFTTEMEELISKFIEKDYMNVKRRNLQSTHLKLNESLLQNGFPKIAYKSLRKRIKDIPIHDLESSRLGRVGAYGSQPTYLHLDLTTPVHGEFAWNIVHIDHTELDICLLSSVTGRPLGRCYLSLMLDAYTRKILAHFLSFDPPSYRSIMMLFRDCVRRHGRLPFSVVVDGGADFKSVYFETLLSAYAIWKLERPGKMPRVGSPLERVFGSTNTRFLYNLDGNTQVTKEPRTITKENDPELHAIWHLKALDIKMGQFFYEVYNKRAHPSLYNMSPNEKFEKSKIIHGERKHLYIPYDLTFYMLTLPGPDAHGTTRILTKDGVKVNNDYYDALEFKKEHKLLGQPIHVRVDPGNYGVVYAYLNKKWIQAFSSEYPTLRNRSEKEIQIISKEMKELNRKFNRDKGINAKGMTSFLLSIEPDEELLRQRLKDYDNRTIIKSIDGEFNLQQYGFREESIDSDSIILPVNASNSKQNQQKIEVAIEPERTAYFGDY